MKMLPALLLVAALLAACVQAPGQGDEGDGPGSPAGDWILTDGAGPGGPIPILVDNKITMTIQGDRISGTAACNGYGGSIAISDGRLRIGDLMQTLMGCVPDVADSEAAFMAAIARVTGFERSGDTLILGGPDVSLVFALVPPVADQEIVGTSWVLESLILGDAVSSVLGDEATLELRPDGTVAGGTGCRTFDGRYTINGHEILFTEVVATDQACAPDLARQDEHVLNVLGDGFTAVVAGPNLTLSAAGNLGLGYRAKSAV